MGRFYTIWVTIKTEPKWVSEILLLYENFILYFIDVLSHIQLFVTPWTVTHQAPLSMEFSKREFLSGLLFPTPGQSSWPRDWTCISCRLLHWQADSLPLYHLRSPFLWYRYTYFNTLLFLKCKFTLNELLSANNSHDIVVIACMFINLIIDAYFVLTSLRLLALTVLHMFSLTVIWNVIKEILAFFVKRQRNGSMRFDKNLCLNNYQRAFSYTYLYTYICIFKYII